MPVLVTGASGFLGGRLTQLLLERGEEVTILARPSSDLRHLPASGKMPGKVRLVTGDLSAKGVLETAVRDTEFVYHCAACSTDWAPRATYISANVTGTELLVSAARENPHLQRFVHVSTTDVYGYPELPCSEDHPRVDAGLPYNQTKSQGEALVWQTHQQHQLPVTIVRPATIYGPRGKDFTTEIATMLRQKLMATINKGAAPGGFVYVDTVAEAMIAAAHSPATLGQAYNLADNKGVTWAEYLQRFSAHLGTRPPWIDLSFNTAMTMARLFELSHRALGLSGRPLLTQHAVYLLGRNQEFPIQKAQRDFGYEPRIDLEEGLRRSVAWLKTSRL